MSILTLCSCYHDKAKTHDALVDTNLIEGVDTLNFEASHHYTKNFNFVVKSDSLVLLRQQPEESLSGLPTDSVIIYKHQHIVVADIRLLINDNVDSVWVQVARDQDTFGWIHESSLLTSVVPDDPISQFISIFSDTHLLVFLVVLTIISLCYLWHSIRRKGAKVVHFKDIDSFYPALLAVTVALAATFYSSLQMFATETWRHFYYHPSLNPFGLPNILSVFICSVWAILILCVSTIDDVLHKLPFGQATLYLSGLLGVCAINYVIFSLLTLYYVGYVLLVFYIIYAIHRYLHTTHEL